MSLFRPSNGKSGLLMNAHAYNSADIIGRILASMPITPNLGLFYIDFETK